MMIRLTIFIVSVLLVFFNPVKAEQKKDSKLEEIVVTGTKVESPIEDLPVTVNFVTKQGIESQPQYHITNFGELIRDLPGVHVGQYQPSAPPWIHLRGTGYFIGRTGYLIDGIPVPPFFSITIHNSDIERIEVLKGPSSALYGPNAMGGVVNVLTKRGRDDTGLNLEMGYGSRDTYRPHLELGNTYGNFHYYLSYSGDYSGGYKMHPLDVVWELYKNNKTGWLSYASLDDNDYEKEYYALKFGWENQSGTGFWIGYNYQELFLNGGRANRIWLDDGKQGVGNLRFYTKFSDWLKLTLTIGYQHMDRPGPLEDKGPIVSGGKLVGWDSTPTTVSLWENERFPIELQTDINISNNSILTMGFLWLRDTEKRETRSRITGVTSSKSEYTTDNTAFYIQDQTYLLDDRLILLAGLRCDFWEYHDIFDLISTPQYPSAVKKDAITFRGGFKYKISDSLAVRSSGGTGFWPGLPVWFFQNTKTGKTWREANPNLEPEKTWMFDLGFDVDLKKIGTAFSLTPYYGRILDVISYRYDPHPTLAGVNIVRTENLGGAKIYGIEMGLEQKITKAFSIQASLTLNHSEIIKDPAKNGNQLRNSPDYWGTIALIYRQPDLLNGRLAVRFSDDRFYDDENTPLPYYHMKEYTVLDAKLWRDFKLSKTTALSVALSGENLNNKKYETEFIGIHPGRTIFGTVSLKYNF